MITFPQIPLALRRFSVADSPACQTRTIPIRAFPDVVGKHRVNPLNLFFSVLRTAFFMSSLAKVLVCTIISLTQGGWLYQPVTSAVSRFEHTLDFVAHGFSAGLAEMDAHLVGGLADFLYQRGGRPPALWPWWCLRSAWYGFLRSWRSFLRRGCAVRQINYSLLRFTMSFAACLVAPAFSSGSSSRQRGSGRTVPGYGHRYGRGPGQAGS